MRRGADPLAPFAGLRTGAVTSRNCGSTSLVWMNSMPSCSSTSYSRPSLRGATQAIGSDGSSGGEDRLRWSHGRRSRSADSCATGSRPLRPGSLHRPPEELDIVRDQFAQPVPARIVGAPVLVGDAVEKALESAVQTISESMPGIRVRQQFAGLQVLHANFEPFRAVVVKGIGEQPPSGLTEKAPSRKYSLPSASAGSSRISTSSPPSTWRRHQRGYSPPVS